MLSDHKEEIMHYTFLKTRVKGIIPPGSGPCLAEKLKLGLAEQCCDDGQRY
jgi:hypothetical protein